MGDRKIVRGMSIWEGGKFVGGNGTTKFYSNPYIYMRVCVCVFVCGWVWEWVWVRMHVCERESSCIYIYVCVWVCMYMRFCANENDHVN